MSSASEEIRPGFKEILSRKAAIRRARPSGIQGKPTAGIGDQLRAAGHEVKDENMARVSPLAHAHVVPNGSYFQSPRPRVETASEPVMA